MKKMSKTIVFFGSGPVAAASLKLLAHDFTIEAVITKPRPHHHRGTVPVLDAAESLGLPVLTAANKQELNELMRGRPVKSDVAVLIDFGIIVSQEVIDYFPLGIINSHFSLLPEWRGADPITFAILSGQPKTGVSLMLIDAGMDTGKLLAQKSQPIKPDATAVSLTEELITLSHELLRQHLPRYVSGELNPKEQPHQDRATYSRKLTKEDGQIDWTKPAEQIEREIRAFKEWPKSYGELGGKEVVITAAHTDNVSGTPGEVTVNDKQLVVACGTGSLVIDSLKPAGKNEMSSEAFLAGHRHLFE